MKASNRSDQVLTKEQYPEPRSKAGYEALFHEILSLPGGVAKIVMEKDQPVRVWRWKERPEMEEEEPTLDAALSRAEIEEYSRARVSPAQVLFDMMALLQRERQFPVCWATGRDQGGLLKTWLDWDGLRDSLMGIPVERLKSLPEDTLLLCGAPHTNAEPDEVAFALKTSIELEGVIYGEEELHDTPGRKRHPTEERHLAVRAASNGPAGNGGAGWHPPRFIRERVKRRPLR